jgi:hypothetical protein
VAPLDSQAQLARRLAQLRSPRLAIEVAGVAPEQLVGIVLQLALSLGQPAQVAEVRRQRRKPLGQLGGNLGDGSERGGGELFGPQRPGQIPDLAHDQRHGAGDLQGIEIAWHDTVLLQVDDAGIEGLADGVDLGGAGLVEAGVRGHGETPGWVVARPVGGR